MARDSYNLGVEVLRVVGGEIHEEVRIMEMRNPDDPIVKYQYIDGGSVYGLFSVGYIPKISLIGMYSGVIEVEGGRKRMQDPGDEGQYSMSLPRYFGTQESLYVNSTCFANEMSYMNDGKGTGKRENCEYCGAFVNGVPVVLVVTSGTILENDQLLVDYGETTYWACREEETRIKREINNARCWPFDQPVIGVKRVKKKQRRTVWPRKRPC
jgi:hypothetical protein